MKRIIALALSLVCILGLASCGKKDEPETAQAYTTAKVEELAEAGVFSEELEPLDGDTAFGLYRLAEAGLVREDLTDCAILRSSGATCEEAAVLILADEAKAGVVKTALEEYLQLQIDSNTDYRPDEIPKLENAVLNQVDNTVLMVVAENPKVVK